MDLLSAVKTASTVYDKAQVFSEKVFFKYVLLEMEKNLSKLQNSSSQDLEHLIVNMRALLDQNRNNGDIVDPSDCNDNMEIDNEPELVAEMNNFANCALSSDNSIVNLCHFKQFLNLTDSIDEGAWKQFGRGNTLLCSSEERRLILKLQVHIPF